MTTRDNKYCFETILAALGDWVQSRGEQTAYTFIKSKSQRPSLTYRQLDERARSIANELLKFARPGDRALLGYPAGLEFIEAFLGCLYAGIVAVPTYPPRRKRNSDRVVAIARDCDARLLLGTSDAVVALSSEVQTQMPNARVLATDEIANTARGILPTVSPDQVAFLQYTSGSTADPKGVMVTHGNIIANELHIQKCFEFTPQSVMVSWLPMFHDMGLIGGVLAPLFVGFPAVLMASSTFLFDPIEWLSAISEFRGTCAGAPNFAYDLCVKKITEEQKRAIDLSSWTVAFNGSEPVRAETLDQFSEFFAENGFRREAFFPCYGMAETTLLVSGGPPLVFTPVVTLEVDALEQHRVIESASGKRIVGCGRVTADMDVRIVNPETCRLCPADEIGEIWVKGPSVALGYLNCVDETAAAFEATLIGDDGRWLRTGDYGFLRDQVVYITGRLKDLIVIRGRNVYPQDVERVVERHLKNSSANCTAAFSIDVQGEERLVVVCEGTREIQRQAHDLERAADLARYMNRILSDIRADVLAQCDIQIHYFAMSAPLAFPRTSSGKVQRRACLMGLIRRTLPCLELPGCISSLEGISRDSGALKA